MLTKEAKNQAERIRPQVAELLGELSKVAKVWEKKSANYCAASSLFNAWQWFDRWDYIEQEPQETKKAKETHNTNPREWSATVERLSNEKEAARVALFVARVNFTNWANYTAEKLAELVRPFWRLVALRKGCDDLGALLTPKYNEKRQRHPHAFRLSFKITGGNVGAELFPSSFVRLSVGVDLGGVACGIWGEVDGVKMGEDVPDTPREIKQPHRLTVGEYLKTTKRLKEIKDQAGEILTKLSHEARELVRSSGLYGFAEFLASYTLHISK